MKIFILIFIFFIGSNSFAYDALRTVRLTSMSSSGRTIRLDIGKMHGLSSSDTGELSKRDGPVGRPSYNFVGSGKLVKLFQNYSYWYFPVVKNELLKVNDIYQIQVRKNVYKGRVDIPIKYNITSATSAKARRDRNEGVDSDFPSSLTYQDELNELDSLRDGDDGTKFDGIEITKDRSLESQTPVIVSGSAKDTYSVDTYVRDNSEKINYARKEQLAKDQNLSQIKKINSKKYGYDELYQDIDYKTENDLTHMSHSEFSKYVKDKEYKTDVPESLKRMIEKEGELWSAQMDDTELANFINRTGINKEVYRRSRAQLYDPAHEFSLYLAAHLNQNTSDVDENYQSPGSTAGLMYEYHMQKIDPDYLAWSIDGLIERSVFNFDAGGFNARMNFNAIGGHLNYYFYNYPMSKRKLAFFIGAGLKYGIGELTSVNISQVYDYSLLALPSAHLGVKYRIPVSKVWQKDFNIGFGFICKITVDNYRFSSVDAVSDDISGNQSANNIRLDLGLSFYF